ncbi:YjbH domain-containing protein [Dyadobacter sp. NIV53]|uniref:YjbH domain-containing protein n=1 Tax=Dyadobacter sp. NIV53 TaxID=2861765 RepID=UPI001E4562AD|nr:YjbH domain-containing protein [Dyadobacter sp. NIV53]
MNQFSLIRKGSFLLPFLILILTTMPAIAQLNITGKPGLIYTPGASFNEEGAFLFGGNYKPKKYSFRRNNSYSENTYFLNLTLLKRLEIGLNLTRSNGVGKISGIGDRQLDVKYLLVKEGKVMPAVAIIVSAPFSINNSFTTNAVVASKSVPLSADLYADFSAGYGSPYYLLRNDSEKSNYNIFNDMKWKMKKDLSYAYLSGMFGGVNLHYRNNGGLLLEWDSQQINMGAYAVLFKKWTVQAALLNFDRISFGTSYALNLKTLPRRLKNAETDPVSTPLAEPEQKNVLKNFENVTVDTLQNKVYYEQRLNRNPMYGLLEMKQALSDSSIKEYLPMFQGIIMGSYSLDPKISVKSLNAAERKVQEQKFPLHKKRYLADFWLPACICCQFRLPSETGTKQCEHLTAIPVLYTAGTGFKCRGSFSNYQRPGWKGKSNTAGTCFPEPVSGSQ